MAGHDTLRSLRLFPVRTKFDTYVLEGGSVSMVGQLARMGLQALVVDSAGIVYAPGEWYRSGTYWQGGQERLLAIDNRTLSYRTWWQAERRSLLSALSWGLQAAAPERGGAAARCTPRAAGRANRESRSAGRSLRPAGGAWRGRHWPALQPRMRPWRAARSWEMTRSPITTTASVTSARALAARGSP